jgi:hypothetical protein
MYTASAVLPHATPILELSTGKGDLKKTAICCLLVVCFRPSPGEKPGSAAARRAPKTGKQAIVIVTAVVIRIRIVVTIMRTI